MNYKRVEPGIETIVHQHFSDLPFGLSEDFERKGEEIWRMSTRTDSRKGEVVACHQNSGIKEFASLKTMRYETGSQWSFFKRGVTWS